MPNFIIDTETKGHRKIYNRLAKLKTTISIQDNGQYRNSPECSQISIKSTLSADDLDHWLWENNLDYIGVVEDKK